MRDAVEKVTQFARAFGGPVASSPRFLSGDREALRVGLIKEELGELEAALKEGCIVETLDALGDLAYVVIGMAVEMGLPLAEAFDEIHRSNMTKLGEDGRPVLREDGKVIKGPRFEPPDLVRVMKGAVL
jgi:predicted HAD superfamily Cof-like phosphohydrolase